MRWIVYVLTLTTSLLAIFFGLSFWQQTALLLLVGLLLLVVLRPGRILTFLCAKILHRRLKKDISLVRSLDIIRSYVPRIGINSQGSTVVLREYLRGILQQSSSQTRFVIIGGVGAGKTSLMLAVYWAQLWRFWNRSHYWHYLKWEEESIEARLQALKDPSRTILFLDGIDECLTAHQDYRSHLDRVFQLSQNVAKVVISVQKGYLPQEIEGQGKNHLIHYIGHDCFEILQKIELGDINPSKLPSYRSHSLLAIRRNRKSRKTFQANSHLLKIPLLLRTLENTRSSSRVMKTQSHQFLYPILSSYIHWDIGKNSTQREIANHYFTFLNQLAQELLMKFSVNLPIILDIDKLEQVFEESQIPPGKARKDFLTQTHLLEAIEGGYRFRHGMFLAYFLAWNGYHQDLSTEQTHFIGFPIAKALYQEMCWHKYLQEPQAVDAQYRIHGKVEKLPLSTIGYADVLSVNRLYLALDSSSDVRFLRNLDQLEAVHVERAAKGQVPNQLVEELPHEQAMLHLHVEDAEETQVMGFREKEAQLWLDEHQSIPIKARALQAIHLSAQSDPLLPMRYPGNKKPSSQALLDLFETNIQANRPDGFWKELAHSSEEVRISELILGVGEMDIFDRIQLIDFADGQRNLVLTNHHAPTLIVQSLEHITRQLFQVLGEDDEHREEFTDEDEAQIEDGHWSGRKWFWKNSTSYPHAIHLFMEEAGKVNLRIWGIEITEEQGMDLVPASTDGFSGLD